VFFIIASVTLFVTEFLTASLFLYVSGKTVIELNNNIILNFLVSIPSRIMEYTILAFLIIKKRTILKANILKPVFESRISVFLTLTALIFDLMFMLTMVKIITYEKILNNISEKLQIIIILGITLFPLINLSALIWGFYNIKNRELKDKKMASDKINDIVAEINLYTDTDKYDNIKWKLYEISKEMKEISGCLYDLEK
jgi:hypothetical protein